MRSLRLWIVECRYRRTGVRRLQELQAAQTEDLVDEIREKKREALHNLADAVLRLQAVSDQIEETIHDLERNDE